MAGLRRRRVTRRWGARLAGAERAAKSVVARGRRRARSAKGRGRRSAGIAKERAVVRRVRVAVARDLLNVESVVARGDTVMRRVRPARVRASSFVRLVTVRVSFPARAQGEKLPRGWKGCNVLEDLYTIFGVG